MKNSERFVIRKNSKQIIDYGDGQKWYYMHEQYDHLLHREDGPAIDWGDGSSTWYYNGVQVGPNKMPLTLFFSYVKWQLKRLHEDESFVEVN